MPSGGNEGLRRPDRNPGPKWTASEAAKKIGAFGNKAVRPLLLSTRRPKLMININPMKNRLTTRILLGLGLACLGAPAASLLAAEPPAAVQLSVRKAIRISFQSQEGESYQLYRSRDASTWEKYGEVLVGTGQEITVTFLTDADDHSLFRAETLSGEPVEVVKSIEDFKDYQTWKLVRTLIGPDPALGGAHGEPIRHRSIYVWPAEAKLVNGELPVGTVLVKELREDIDGQPGAVTDALTVMVKRGGSFNPGGGGGSTL